MILYRGQLITPDELENFQKSVGKIISMTSFTSTTRNLNVARYFCGMGDQRPQLESVIFEIIFQKSEFTEQPPLPFADIHHVSVNEYEDEILLCIGTVMRLESIRTDLCIIYIRLYICPYEKSNVKALREAIAAAEPTLTYNVESIWL